MDDLREQADMTQRTCTRPGCDKPHYGKGMCKPCYRRDYYLRNKERENAWFKAYREANLEREKARWAEYHAKNREELNARKRERYAADPEAGRERTRRWRFQNPGYKPNPDAQRRREIRAEYRLSPDKVCTKCEQVKPKTDFYAYSRNLDGRQSWCKSCFRAHCRSVYDPAATRARRQRWYTERGGREITAQRQRRWYAENPEKAREQARRYQARKLAATVEKVDYSAIVERDGMVCHICRGEIPDLDDLHFDHVIPLTRGGEHSMANIKPAHASCNLRKNDKLMEELDWLPSA